MKILYIHQYFITPEEPGGTRSYWFSRELVSRGHKVVMITSTNKNHQVPQKINIDGIDVIYVKNEYSNYFSPWKKVLSFIKFVVSSIKQACKERNVDVVFATSTPLTVGIVALWLKSRKGWKYIFEVRDLWPEFPIQIGVIKNKFVIRILRLLEKKIYEKAQYVDGRCCKGGNSKGEGLRNTKYVKTDSILSSCSIIGDYRAFWIANGQI